MQVVRSKVEEWVRQGYVTELAEPAWCTNPLSVVSKMDNESGQIKYRVVLDLSRHVKRCIEKQHLNMDDLRATAALRQVDEFMCVFDLENQFFHVQLAPKVCKYFGFAVANQQGQDCFYQFKVMIYGLTTAVAVVDRLIKPIQSYLHDLGVRWAIYVDDGQVVGSTRQRRKRQCS